MTEYLVEIYVARRDSACLPSAAARATRTARALRMNGVDVRYVRTMYVPEDEVCFHVFEAASPEAVTEAAEQAGIPGGRVLEAADVPRQARERWPS